MNSDVLIEALMRPALDGDSSADAELLDRYCRRLLEIDREPSNQYLSENRDQVLDRLGSPRAKAEFVLRAWRVASATDWQSWASLLDLENVHDHRIGELACEVGAMILEHAASETSVTSIEEWCDLIEDLTPALAQAEVDVAVARLQPAAEEAVGSDWTEDAEALVRQVARHQLVRAVELAVPDASEALAEERSKDVLWPIDEEKVVTPLILTGWREMGADLPEETYGHLLDAVPEPDRETEPAGFAEAVATRIEIKRLGSFAVGPSIVTGHLKEVDAVRHMGSEFRDQMRAAAVACIGLAPRSSQLTWLVRVIGRDPGKHAIDLVKEWSEDAGKGPTSTVIKDLMPLAVAADWMEAFAACEYEEPPVLKAVEEVLLKEEHNSSEQRERMARSLELLGLRTKKGPDKVAKMIVDLLNPRRKKHHKNNIDTALILCRTVGVDHGRAAEIEKQLIAYSKKWKKHKFTPEQNRSIVAAGVMLPSEYLSKKARTGIGGMIDDAAHFAGGVVEKVTKQL